jgi:predicted house-cleaning noncanonical NTP pyrophosphatase (MazG superfamily)
MDNTDVKAIVDDEIKKFVNDKLDKEISKILRNKNSATRDELISTIKNAMDSLVKVLWQKKEFWKTDIK